MLLNLKINHNLPTTSNQKHYCITTTFYKKYYNFTTTIIKTATIHRFGHANEEKIHLWFY